MTLNDLKDSAYARIGSKYIQGRPFAQYATRIMHYTLQAVESSMMDKSAVYGANEKFLFLQNSIFAVQMC